MKSLDPDPICVLPIFVFSFLTMNDGGVEATCDKLGGHAHREDGEAGHGRPQPAGQETVQQKLGINTSR